MAKEEYGKNYNECIVLSISVQAWKRLEAWQHTFHREWVKHGETGRDAVECRQEDASEAEGEGLQNCGHVSSVVWCRYLGNNERTRSTTRSKWDVDADMDVWSDKEG